MMRIHRSVRDTVPVDLVWEECTLDRRGSIVVETVLDDGADYFLDHKGLINRSQHLTRAGVGSGI